MAQRSRKPPSGKEKHGVPGCPEHRVPLTLRFNRRLKIRGTCPEGCGPYKQATWVVLTDQEAQ